MPSSGQRKSDLPTVARMIIPCSEILVRSLQLSGLICCDRRVSRSLGDDLGGRMISLTATLIPINQVTFLQGDASLCALAAEFSDDASHGD